MKIKLTIRKDYLNTSVPISFEIVFTQSGAFFVERNECVSANYFGQILRYIKDRNKDCYNEICKDLQEWGAMASLLDGVTDDFVVNICDYINSVVSYEGDSVDDVRFILDNVSTSLVASFVAAGIVSPASVFAELPANCRKKIAEAIWEQRLIDEYDSEGNPISWRTKKMVYISYKITVPTIRNVEFTAIRCVCPSTANTHWLLVPDHFAKDPKGAIAWTCRIPEKLLNLGSYVIKRQGDVFLFELTRDFSDEEINEIMNSRLVHHPTKTFWDKYIDEA